MQVSVIFTTYNQPQWLEKVLWGFSVQTHRDFEIIVADDGSGPETKELIERMRTETGMEITHVWHDDNGFQKCQILNKAIVASRFAYLVFTDGDCIPAPDFLEWHVRLAERDRFLSGGYVKLPMDVSQAISREYIVSGRATEASWLRQQGVGPSMKLLKLHKGAFFGLVLDSLSPTRASWNGHNASTWKEHVLATNGFDERMQYGGQDREFGERLENMGIRGKRIRFRAACVHLDHPRGYARPESIAKNKAIRAETRAQKTRRTPFGIIPESPATDK
jgi:glycosyltransferase involved in cell wall biosynthesis